MLNRCASEKKGKKKKEREERYQDSSHIPGMNVFVNSGSVRRWFYSRKKTGRNMETFFWTRFNLQRPPQGKNNNPYSSP